jgi:transcription elongation factor GreA
MANEIYLTSAGYEKLKKELEHLKGPMRHQIADAIREAKSHGDLKENAAYHEAKLNQTRLDSRIADLEKALQLAKIVEKPETNDNTAHMGSKVLLLDVEFDDEMTIELVGSLEADPTKDYVSITSPLGEALLGKGPGEEVEFETPGGLSKFKIVSIS